MMILIYFNDGIACNTSSNMALARDSYAAAPIITIVNPPSVVISIDNVEIAANVVIANDSDSVYSAHIGDPNVNDSSTITQHMDLVDDQLSDQQVDE
jgi:hypothetical protein